MKVLITGGGGYIGSVVEQLLEDCRIKTKIFDKDDGFSDILDLDMLLEAMGDCDAVVHLAAIVGDPNCNKQPDLARQTNQEGTYNVIMCAKILNIEKVVYASTCSVYGTQPNAEMCYTDDKQFINPLGVYGWTKYVGETMMLNNGYKVLRFGTAYGQSPKMRYDLMINAMVRNAVLKSKIEVWGRDNWRPFAHVKSIATAIGLVLKGLWTCPLYHVVEFNCTVGRIAQKISNILEVPVIYKQNQPNDIRSYRANPTYFEQEGHFKEKVKEIADNVVSSL